MCTLCLAVSLIAYFCWTVQSPQLHHNYIWVKKGKVNLSEPECSQLRSIILNSVASIFKKKKFLEVVKDLQRCPWQEDHTDLGQLRKELGKCCNASFSMIMTQKNAGIGDTLHFDADEKVTQKVTTSLHSLFPKESPFQQPFRSCAVVGNGGILNNSLCGAKIDQADFVFRLNFPPMNWTSDIGTKTNLVTSNPSILVERFSSLTENRKPFITMVKQYGSPLILIPAFSYWGNTEVSLRVHHTMDDFDLNSKVLFFNPDYLRNLTAYWKSKRLKFNRLSSGIIVMSAAMELCHQVTLYGFWPFSQSLDGAPIPHHYYDNVPPKPGVHSMSEEFYQYLKMHIQGSLRLNLERC